MTCATCRYYQTPEGVCTVLTEWIGIHYPESHKCEQWEASQ